MSTGKQRQQAVRDIVVLLSGLAGDQVIIGNDGGPVPDPPYATILRITTVRVGIDTRSVIEAVGGEAAVQIEGIRETSFSVQFFGDDSEDYVEGLRMAPHDRSAVAIADAAGISIVDDTNNANLTQVDEVEWQDRAGLDLRIRWRYTKAYVGADAGGTIEHARATGDIDGIAVDVEADWP